MLTKIWRKIALAGGALVLVGCAAVFPSTDATIDWNAPQQVIDGFGASATGYVGGISSTRADQWFSPDKGLGFSLLRIKLIPDTLDYDCGCVANNPHYACLTGPRSGIVTGDLEVAQLAAQRGVRIIATPWSPPAEMKSSNKYCGGGQMLGTPQNYSRYADTLASFPALLHAHNVPIDAISIQNEPDFQSLYDTCLWTARQFHEFVPYLFRALQSAGYPHVAIAAPEQSQWSFDLAKETLSDPSSASDIGLLLGHAYHSENARDVPNIDHLHVWQSEVSDLGAFNGDMEDALRWARSISDYMNAGANAWMYWNLECGTQQFNSPKNMCLTSQDGSLAKRAWVLGQFAKFIRPGWHRISVTSQGPLLITAYRGPSTQFAVVVVNSSRWFGQQEKIRLAGFPARPASVTPWVTTAHASLAAQKPVSVAEDNSITWNIPRASVVTFVGNAS